MGLRLALFTFIAGLVAWCYFAVGLYALLDGDAGAPASVAFATVEPVETGTVVASVTEDNETASVTAPAPVPARGTKLFMATGGGAFDDKRLPPGGPGTTRVLIGELRRAGCYSGPATDTWTAEAKSAMRRALLVLNAELPVDQADQILVTLVSGMKDDACTCVATPHKVASLEPASAASSATVAITEPAPKPHAMKAVPASRSAKARTPRSAAIVAKAGPQRGASQRVAGARTGIRVAQRPRDTENMFRHPLGSS
jgi:hypothetical protein